MKSKEKGAQVLRGFCMGCADVIPGVSGGTVALVLGIYARLVGSIRTLDAAFLRFLLRGRFWAAMVKGLFTEVSTGDAEMDRRAEAVHFIGFLVLGILLAIVAGAGVITWARVHHPVPTRAFFFGLVLLSVPVPWRLLKKRTPWSYVAALVSGVLTWIVLGLGEVPANPALWYIFVCGAIAICAMILPGISGAFFLLMLGAYDPVLEAVHRLAYSLDFSAVPIIASLVAGILVGITGFARVLHWLLTKHHDVTMACLVGLMLGSLRVIWPFKHPGPEGVRDEFLSNRLPWLDGGVDPQLWAALATFVVAATIVIGLDRVGQRYGRE
ncbi:MAG: DUF368 domain-containing protein [Deltaproteobacteria bacterium]|nr:DUF368 domain-containing protein [Deltaproteobacteria bacterium]